MKFSEMPYARPDLNELKQQLQALTDRLKAAPDYAAAREAFLAQQKLFELMRDLAEKNDIPWQTKHYVAGGNDAGVIQRSREGVRTVVMSAAVRYLHAPSTVASVRDFDYILKLARLFIEAISQEEEE